MAAIDITGAGGGGISNVTGTSPVVVTIVGTARNVSLDQTQFKTINGNSIFGAGNIVISTGLTNWTEAFNSGTQATSSFTALNAAANVNAALVPKGTGAIVAQIPDGTVAGGNARGSYAVDFQMQRTNANQVALGANSGILSGRYNRNDADRSVIGGGASNIITSTGGASIIGGGFTNTISDQGLSFIGSGDNQTISGAGRSNFIGGGGTNSISGSSLASFIGAGTGNSITSSFATIVGGTTNITADLASFIGGGDDIQIGATSLGRNIVVGGVTQRINAGTGGRNFIGGGEAQTISGTSRNSIIGGGASNNIGGSYSGIFSGQSNTNNGTNCVVMGGQSNTVTGTYSSAVGYANTATQFHSHMIGNLNVGSNNLVFLIGSSNTGTAQMSVAIGDSCTVSASNTLGTGNFSSAYLQGQQAHANGRFTITGDAQGGEAILRLVDGFTDAQTKEIYLDGSSLRITGPTNSAMTVNIDIVAIVTAISGTATGVTVGDMFSQNEICAYKNIAGTGTVVGSFSLHKLHDASMAACDTAFATTGAALQVFFTGPNFAGGGSVTLRIVAKARIVETRY